MVCVCKSTSVLVCDVVYVHVFGATITNCIAFGCDDHYPSIVSNRHTYTLVCEQGPLLFWRYWTEPVQSQRSQRRRLSRKEYFFHSISLPSSCLYIKLCLSITSLLSTVVVRLLENHNDWEIVTNWHPFVFLLLNSVIIINSHYCCSSWHIARYLCALYSLVQKFFKN